MNREDVAVIALAVYVVWLLVFVSAFIITVVRDSHFRRKL